MSTSIWEYNNVLGRLHASFPYFTYLVNGDSLSVFYNTYKVTTLSVRKDLSLFDCGYSLCWDGHAWNVMSDMGDAVNGAVELITDSPVFSPYHLIHDLRREIAELKKTVETRVTPEPEPVFALLPAEPITYEMDEYKYETPGASPNNNIEWEHIVEGEETV